MQNESFEAKKDLSFDGKWVILGQKDLGFDIKWVFWGKKMSRFFMQNNFF